MYRKKKFLAIIPARSGSKGVKNKNIRVVDGKHLIGYTIEAAIKSSIFDEVIVSTDSEIYAEISEGYGAKVPFIRREELSSDISTTEEVIIDTITKMKELGKEYDYFVLLQPTSPLRTPMDITNAVDMIINEKLLSVVSVCELEHSLKICNKLSEDMSMENFINKVNNKRRQELEKYYRINGAIYICDIKRYMVKRDFYNESSKAYVMSQINSVDIDTELDFIIVEAILKNNYKI